MWNENGKTTPSCDYLNDDGDGDSKDVSEAQRELQQGCRDGQPGLKGLVWVQCSQEAYGKSIRSLRSLEHAAGQVCPPVVQHAKESSV